MKTDFMVTKRAKAILNYEKNETFNCKIKRKILPRREVIGEYDPCHERNVGSYGAGLPLLTDTRIDMVHFTKAAVLVGSHMTSVSGPGVTYLNYVFHNVSSEIPTLE